jgi:hypothetical protein
MVRKKLQSAADAAEDQLKAGAKKLQAQLATVEKAAEALATKAKASVAKRKDRARTPASGSAGAAPASHSATERVPDDSWTVADLRAEAKRRGLTGYSGKTKAQLLAELRG